MNTHSFLPPSLLFGIRSVAGLAAALCLLVAPGLNAAVFFNFDTSAQFTDNFVSTSGTGTIAWSSSAGVGGVEGRVNTAVPTTNGKTSFYNQTWDPNTGSLEVSFLFLATAFTDTTASRVAVGIAENQTNFQGNSHVQARLIKSGSTTATFEIRDATGGGTTTTNISLDDNDWYSMTMTVDIASATSYAVEASLYNLGASGTDTPVLVGTASGIRNVPTFFTSGVADPVFAGFMVQNAGGGGQAFDNVSIGIVPEPSAIAGATFGILGLMIFVRKRGPWRSA